MVWDRPPESAAEALQQIDDLWSGRIRKEGHVPTVLTRDQIREVDDRKIEFVPVPEWAEEEVDPEGGLYIRGLSGKDRDDFEMAMIESRRDPNNKRKTTQEINLKNLRAKLVVRTAVDSDDPDTCKPVFTVEDIPWLGNKSAAGLQRLYAVAQRLSGLSPEDVEELTAELGEAQSNGSGTDSPDTSGTAPLLSASTTSVPESSPDGESSTAWSRSESNA